MEQTNKTTNICRVRKLTDVTEDEGVSFLRNLSKKLPNRTRYKPQTTFRTDTGQTLAVETARKSNEMQEKGNNRNNNRNRKREIIAVDHSRPSSAPLFALLDRAANSDALTSRFSYDWSSVNLFHYKGLDACSLKYNFGLQLLSIPPLLCNVKRRTLVDDHRSCGSAS